MKVGPIRKSFFLVLLSLTLAGSAVAEPAVTPHRIFFPGVTKGPVATPGILTVENNPVQSGATTFANWTIPNFKSGVFDRGDGAGYVGPVSSPQRVDISSVTGPRTLKLLWFDTATPSQQHIDSLVLNVSNVAVPTTGVLSVEQNPVAPGATTYANWDITTATTTGFKSGTFDRGDGNGFQGVIASKQRVDIPNVTSQRTVRVQWTDASGQLRIDSLVLNVSGTPVTPQPTGTCNASNPDWRGANPSYPFCVKLDLGWTDGGGSVRTFNKGTNQNLALHWNIYGINSIRLHIDPSTQQCAPAGSNGTRNVPVGGSNGANDYVYPVNVNEFGYGCFKIELFVTRTDSQEVGYNEKFLWIK